MMRKIIFITDAPHDPRMAKRQNTYIKLGYQTEVYAFLRPNGYTPSDTYQPIIVGDLSNLPYLKRFRIIYRAVKQIVNKYNGEDVVFHIFNLQIAMFFRLLSHSPYIYEEADLVHTYVHSSLAIRFFELINRRVIRHARLSLFTSEGFLNYHLGKKRPVDYFLVPNRLTPAVLQVKDMEKAVPFDPHHIRFGFVGGIRFQSTVYFIEHVLTRYPQHEFHFFGVVMPRCQEKYEELTKYPNFFPHGPFRNPTDLPKVYSSIHIVLSTYDVAIANVRYAEPNKLYEAIYFRTPIIVTSGTYLASRVQEMGIGMDVNPLDGIEIDAMIEQLTHRTYQSLMAHLNQIPKEEAVDDDFALTAKLERTLKVIR